MRGGADVIFQATFFDGRWRGHADFLFKRPDRPSPALGEWSYDIADTKLARSVKAGAILQMCVYASLLEGLQGIAPEWLYVITGDGVKHPHRTDDFSSYFRWVRARFDARVTRRTRGRAGRRRTRTRSTIVASAVWYPMCIDRRRADDHLSIVAGMRRLDTERLTAAGVPTLAGLAVLRARPCDRGDRPPTADPDPRTGAPATSEAGDRRVRLRADPTRSGRHRPRPQRPARAIAVGPLLRHRGRSVGDGGRPRIPARGRRGGRRSAALPRHLGDDPRRRRRPRSSASSGSSSSASTPTPRCTSTTTAATSRAPSSA